MYLATGSTVKVREAMGAGLLGELATPASGPRRVKGTRWGADNGCFNAATYKGDEAWFAWLAALDPEGCIFAVAPDVVGDAKATLPRSLPWLAKIRALGMPAAFVAQNGAEDMDLPWDSFDVLFIGGSTEWKLGTAARVLAAQAKARGKWVHMGRVNSERRMKYADAIGCDSSDGTFIAFGPDVNLPRTLAWIRGVNDQMTLEMTA